jgi:hypothetical protein
LNLLSRSRALLTLRISLFSAAIDAREELNEAEQAMGAVLTVMKSRALRDVSRLAQQRLRKTKEDAEERLSRARAVHDAYLDALADVEVPEPPPSELNTTQALALDMEKYNNSVTSWLKRCALFLTGCELARVVDSHSTDRSGSSVLHGGHKDTPNKRQRSISPATEEEVDAAMRRFKEWEDQLEQLTVLVHQTVPTEVKTMVKNIIQRLRGDGVDQEQSTEDGEVPEPSPTVADLSACLVRLQKACYIFQKSRQQYNELGSQSRLQSYRATEADIAVCLSKVDEVSHMSRDTWFCVDCMTG